MLGELRVLDPDVPRLGSADRLADLLARAVEVFEQHLDRHVAAQHDLVADQHADHVLVLAREADRVGDLLLVAGEAIVDPGADRDVQVVPVGELRDQAEGAEGAVGADRVGLAGEQREIGLELGITRHVVEGRVLVSLVGREGEALDPRGPFRLAGRLVDECPERPGQCRKRCGHSKTRPAHRQYLQHPGPHIAGARS